MSVINQMLQDLERRRARPVGGGMLSSYVRPPPTASASSVPGWVTNAAAAVVVGVLSGYAASHWLGPAKVSIAASALHVDAVHSEQPRVAVPSPEASAAERDNVAAAISASVLAARTEPHVRAIEVPVTELGVFDAQPASGVEIEASAQEGERQAASASQRPPKRAERSRAEQRAERRPLASETQAHDARLPQAAAVAGTGAAPAQAMVEPAANAVGEVRAAELELRVSARQRAENEYRQALNLLGQGKNDDARNALSRLVVEHPQHDHARHTLIGLLVQARKTGEAEALADERLARAPDHAGFAMLSARIKLERADLAAALATLQRCAPSAQGNADYYAFTAAVLQRLGRHAEAVEQYRGALRLNPASGVWLMGLGISLQALDRLPESRDAFRRAREATGLTADLRMFVDQRIAQLDR